MKIITLIILLTLLLPTSLTFGQNSELKEFVNKGIAFHDQGEYDKAIEMYKKALSIDPNSSLTNYEISFSYMAVKDYKNAEKFSKKVIDKNDGHVLHAYINYGNALDMQEKASKAIKVYEKAMKEFDNYLLYYNHALCCFNSGELDKARASVMKSIDNNISHASSHLILSKIMEKEGVRIKAMLPLYFFLLLEPSSNRAKIEYKTLRGYIDRGVTQTSEKNINISIPMNSDPDFGAAEMMVSLSKASNSLEENKGKTELQLFYENNEGVFKVLGELKKDQEGFLWSFYVPFFYDLANENLTETFSYYISQSLGEEVIKWFDEHPLDFERFNKWMRR